MDIVTNVGDREMERKTAFAMFNTKIYITDQKRFSKGTPFQFQTES